MLKRSSKVTMLMLIVVFCAFAFVGCGTTNDNTSDTTDQTTDTTKDDTTTNDNDISLTITSPTDGDTVEGDKVTVVGNVEGIGGEEGDDDLDLDGIDKVKIQVLTADGNVLGEDTADIADLDQQFSADVKYDISDDMTKNTDGTIDGKIRVYIDDAGDNAATEKTINIKLK